MIFVRRFLRDILEKSARVSYALVIPSYDQRVCVFAAVRRIHARLPYLGVYCPAEVPCCMLHLREASVS